MGNTYQSSQGWPREARNDRKRGKRHNTHSRQDGVGQLLVGTPGAGAALRFNDITSSDDVGRPSSAAGWGAVRKRRPGRGVPEDLTRFGQRLQRVILIEVDRSRLLMKTYARAPKVRREML